jgi:hypothetical protein
MSPLIVPLREFEPLLEYLLPLLLPEAVGGGEGVEVVERGRFAGFVKANERTLLPVTLRHAVSGSGRGMCFLQHFPFHHLHLPRL